MTKKKQAKAKEAVHGIAELGKKLVTDIKKVEIQKLLYLFRELLLAL